METTLGHRIPQRVRRGTMWIGAGVTLAVLIVNALIRRLLPPDPTSLGLIAGTGFAGIAAIVALSVRASLVPRWGWVGAGLVMGVVLLISAALAEPSLAGMKDVSEQAWLFTWMLVMFGWVPEKSRSRACAGTGRRVGWIMVGAAAILAALMLIVPRLLDAMRIGMIL